jgi:oligosaccharide repeat unit polymerase
MEGKGPILSFIGGLYYIPSVWILVRNKEAFKDFLFWPFAILFTLCCFAATGSRYDILQALATFLMCYVLLNRNFPFIKVFFGAVGFFILFGMLGMLRASGTANKTGVDWNLLNGDVSSYFQYALAEGAKRANEEPDLVIMDKVPSQVDFLYGKSYLFLITTYIPRNVWEDKPHSGAYYTGLEIFDVPWGIPPGEEGEVYFNFGTIGFLIFFFFKGYIYKKIVNTFNAYYMYPAVAIIYFLFLFDGTNFVSLALADLLREILFLVIGLKLLKLV